MGGALVGGGPLGVWGQQGLQKRSGERVLPDLIQRAGHQAPDSNWAPVLWTNK